MLGAWAVAGVAMAADHLQHINHPIGPADERTPQRRQVRTPTETRVVNRGSDDGPAATMMAATAATVRAAAVVVVAAAA